MKARKFARNCLLAAIAATSLAAAGWAAAADSGDRKSGKERELARRVQLLQQEKGELSGKLTVLVDKSQELNQAVERAKRDAARVARELAALKTETTQRTAEIGTAVDALEAEKKDLRRKLEDTSTRLKQRENEMRKLEQVAAVQVEALGRQGKLIERCRSDNVKLYEYGDELLQKFRSEGGHGKLSVIGRGEVDSFNIYQDYRDKLDNLRIEPPRLPQ